MSKKVVTIIECDRQGCKKIEQIPSEKRTLIGGYKIMHYPDNWRRIENNGSSGYVCPECAGKFDKLTNDFMVNKKN